MKRRVTGAPMLAMPRVIVCRPDTRVMTVDRLRRLHIPMLTVRFLEGNFAIGNIQLQAFLQNPFPSSSLHSQRSLV